VALGMFQIQNKYISKKKRSFRQQYAPHSSTAPSYGAELSSSSSSSSCFVYQMRMKCMGLNGIDVE
jgi:hypothetical protein